MSFSIFKNKKPANIRFKKQMVIGLAGTLATFVLLLFRIIYTGDLKYSYLVWNLILAWAAWGLGVLFLSLQGRRFSVWKKAAAFIAWIGFLPNTYYLLTDMIHPVLSYDKIPGFHGSNFDMVPMGVMILFDIGLVGLGVWVGWFLGIASLVDIWQLFKRNVGAIKAAVLAELLIAASSFAIYLGRTPRLNTWDLVFRPSLVVRTVTTPLLHPLKNSDAFGMTLLFILLISVIFWSVVLLREDFSRDPARSLDK